MALVATVPIGFLSEIPTMGIGVAVGALQLSRLVHCIATLRFMAFGTGEICVLPHERKRAAHVSFAIEERRFEILRAVACGTIGTRRARRKLAFVRILVAVPAEFVRHGPLEVAFTVTPGASKSRMLAHQREFCKIVIETHAWPVVFPTSGIMAGLAFIAEFHIQESAMVRIGVAALTAGKGQSLK
jgi:hypothetical protein